MSRNVKRCPQCGTENEPEALYCGHCRHEFTGDKTDVPTDVRSAPLTPADTDIPATIPARTTPVDNFIGTTIPTLYPHLAVPKKRNTIRIFFFSLLAVLIIGALIFGVYLGRQGTPAPNKGSASIAQTVPASGNTPVQGNTTTTSVIPSPTSPPPTPTPIAVLPCIVNVGTWTGGSPDWKTLNGILLDDGTNRWSGNGPTIVAPCQLGNATNYAVETKIQVTEKVNFSCFGITVRGSSTSNGWQGYMAGVGQCNNWPNAYITGPGYPGDAAGVNGPFDPGGLSHTYRVEVKGNVIKFLIDGSPLLTLTDNRYLTGSQVGLWDDAMQLQVTSFVVTALSGPVTTLLLPSIT